MNAARFNSQKTLLSIKLSSHQKEFWSRMKRCWSAPFRKQLLGAPSLAPGALEQEADGGEDGRCDVSSVVNGGTVALPSVLWPHSRKS